MQYELKIIAKDLAELQTIVGKLQEPLTGRATSTVVETPPPNVAPAPVVTAAPAPTAASPTPAGAVEVDSRGFPWDGRIHSSSKAKLAKNDQWKLIRGIDKALVAQIEAEYVAQGYGNGSAAPSDDDEDDAPVVTQAPVIPAAPVVPAPIPAMPAPVAVASVPAPATNPAAAVVKKFMELKAAKQVDSDWFARFLKANGVPDLGALNNHPAAIDVISNALDNCAVVTRIKGILASNPNVTEDWINQCVVALGAESLDMLPTNPAAAAQMDAHLTASGL